MRSGREKMESPPRSYRNKLNQVSGGQEGWS